MHSKHTLDQQGARYQVDVLIIGSGLAGLFAALQLVAYQPHLTIALISKEQLEEGNSRYAQGGIAAAIGVEDSFEQHIRDTHLAGDGLCYGPTVEHIIRQGPKVLQDLIRYGVNFSKNAQGEYALGQEGGHAIRRILHQGDATGLEVISALVAQLKAHPRITCHEYHIAVNLIVTHTPHQPDHQGEVLGAYVLAVKTGLVHTFLANQVILATGGAGKTYLYTSNPMVATGDGVAMAYRAGARIGNMEFYQFHPTILYHKT